MTLFALGLNHTTAPLPVRERVVFHVEKLFDALGELTRGKSVAEAAILSTCNRTELYLSAEQPQAAAAWLAEYHRLNPSEISPYLYTLPQEQAVRHAFRVASGLDSMVRRYAHLSPAHLAHRAQLLDGLIDTNSAQSPDSESVST